VEFIRKAKVLSNIKSQIPSKEPRPQGGALKPKFLKPRSEIPKQVRDDNKTRAKPSCHAELVSASGLPFFAFGRHTFHPRPQDGVFRCDLNKSQFPIPNDLNAFLQKI